MATDNMHKKFRGVRPRGFRVMLVDRQTDTQTDILLLITILGNPIGSK